MSWHLIPKPLQDAQIELETTQWLWESTEEQAPTLIDATIHRIAEQDYPFWEGNEQAILQRDRVEMGMRRSSRLTTLMHAWIIFEDAACWSAEERRRQGQAIGKKRSGENFVVWAERELSFAANSPYCSELLEWMELLCRLRNVVVHTNGRAAHMARPDRELIDQWVVSKRGVLLNDGRLDISAAFVSSAFRIVSMAIFALSESFREHHT